MMETIAVGYPDIPRFFTALAEWMGCMVFIFLLEKKMKRRHTYALAAAALVIQSAFWILTENVTLLLWVPIIIMAVVMMIGFLFLCIRGNLYDAVYCGLFAFIIAEFAASLEWQIYCLCASLSQEGSWVLTKGGEYLFLAVFYSITYLAVWKGLDLRRSSDRMVHMTPRELFAVLIIAVAVFSISNLSFIPDLAPMAAAFGGFDRGAIFTIRTIVDFAGIAMMYAYHILRIEIRTRRELDTIQTVLQNHYLQYEQSKESIEMINYKYHDLKHQIEMLRMEMDTQGRNQVLCRMEEEIREYELQNKTGNKTVDTILTSKNIICEKAGISMNCIADGSLLNFMDTLDICSILGNALDNAIECEKKVEDSNKRLIHVSIFSQNDFVILRFENYFEGNLRMKDGIPETTKTRKKEFHGYGIRSIRYTVNKYDGAVSIAQRDKWFELKILIPIKSVPDRR